MQNQTIEHDAATAIDLAGKQHWDGVWTAHQLPAAIDPHSPGASAFVRHFDRVYRKTWPEGKHHGARFLEIGCGQSAWLPYFAREFGFKVAGVDYSDVGCAQTRAILAREGVAGDIYCANLFEPPETLAGGFDIVYSGGVVEHFEDTAGCIKACARFARPGGTIVTVVPNMTGLIGLLQRLLNRAVYAIHVPLDREALVAAHRAAGLEVRFCDYNTLCNLGLVNIDNWRQRAFYTVANELRFRLGPVISLLERALPRLGSTRWGASYIICVATTPG